MSKWSHYERLNEEVRKFSKRTGKTHEEIAEELGVSISTLRNYVYGSKRPSIRFLQRASGLFGCSVTEFIDDPGQEIGGQSANGLSEKRRVISSMMFDGITAGDISDEDAQLLFEDFIAAKNRLQTLKLRTRKDS